MKMHDAVLQFFKLYYCHSQHMPNKYSTFSSIYFSFSFKFMRPLRIHMNQILQKMIRCENLPEFVILSYMINQNGFYHQILVIESHYT